MSDEVEKVLSVRPAYFFFEGESLAELLSYWGILKKKERDKALDLLRQVLAAE